MASEIIGDFCGDDEVEAAGDGLEMLLSAGLSGTFFSLSGLLLHDRRRDDFRGDLERRRLLCFFSSALRSCLSFTRRSSDRLLSLRESLSRTLSRRFLLSSSSLCRRFD